MEHPRKIKFVAKVKALSKKDTVDGLIPGIVPGPIPAVPIGILKRRSITSTFIKFPSSGNFYCFDFPRALGVPRANKAIIKASVLASSVG